MASIRNQIIAAIVSELDGAGKPSGLTVERVPLANVEDTMLPHIAVVLVRESVSRPSSDKLRAFPIRERSLKVKLECRAVAAGPAFFPDEALDPLLCWSTKKLAANPTLGGLALEVEEAETEWESDAADANFGLASMYWTVRFATNSKDQEKGR